MQDNTEKFTGLGEIYRRCRPGSPQYRPFAEELGALFDRYAENGRLRWNNATRCYSGRP